MSTKPKFSDVEEDDEPTVILKKEEPDVSDDNYARDANGDVIYKADGTPRRKSGPRKGAASRPGTTHKAPGRRPGPRPGVRPAAAKRNEPDFRPAIGQLLQMPAMLLQVAGRQINNHGLQADGVAVAMHAPGIAEAVNQAAKMDPRIAQALESMNKAGPWATLAFAVLPLAMQIAANHGVIPSNPNMGIHTPQDLAAGSNANMEQQLREAAAAQAAEQADADANAKLFQDAA